MVLAALVAVHLALAGWQLAPAGKSDALRLHVLSVGNGTCCVIRLPDSQTLIYDIGSRPPYDLERWAVGPLLPRWPNSEELKPVS